MGSKLRISLVLTLLPTNMYKITLAVCLSVAAALPLEDTPDVAAAKEAFATVYKSVEAGDHINLRPVNNDVQAKQIPNMYLDDTADVTAAKEAFMAEFRSVEAGGLMAKQAPAPVAAMPEVAPVQVYSHLAHYPMVYNNMLYHHNIVPAQVQYTVPSVYHHAAPLHYAYAHPYVMPVAAEHKMVEEA